MAGVGRKLLKVAAWVVGGLVVLVGAIAIVVVVMSNRELAQKVTVPVPVADIRIPDGDPEAIARGQYLVDHVLGCKTCHAQDFAGRAEVDDPMIGTLWGPNLTSGGGSVSKTFTPIDWVRAIRHGVAPGFLPATPAITAHWIQKGFRAISLGSDIGVFLSAVRAFRVEVLRESN